MPLRQRIYLRRAARKVGAHRCAEFGEGSLVAPPSTILSPHRVSIGARVLIHPGAMLSVVEEFNGRKHDPHLRIGDGTRIGPGVWISCVGSIDIGEEVLMGHNVLIADTYHEYMDPHTSIMHQPMAEAEAVTIGSGCIVGPHVAILAGVTLGERSFVGANAVVTRDAPPNSVLVGNPARIIRHYDHASQTWIAGDSEPAGAQREPDRA